MKKIVFITLTTFVLSTILTGCKTLDTKEGIGQVAGGALGVIVGSKMDKKDGDKWKVIMGIGGAYLGGEIGKYLDKEDQKRMAEATRAAANSGQNQRWSNTENKTSGEVRVVSTQTKQEPVKVPVLKDKITQVPPLDIIGDTYKAKGATDLYGGPGEDYVAVGKLSSGELVNVVGKVKTKEWYLISQDGIGNGFAAASLFEPSTESLPPPSNTTADNSQVTEKTVASSKTCRTIEQKVSLANGSQQSETINVCKGANGWEKQA